MIRIADVIGKGPGRIGEYDRHRMVGHHCPESLPPTCMEGLAEIVGWKIFLCIPRQGNREEGQTQQRQPEQTRERPPAKN
jgi:hypothetical protein